MYIVIAIVLLISVARACAEGLTGNQSAAPESATDGDNQSHDLIDNMFVGKLADYLVDWALKAWATHLQPLRGEAAISRHGQMNPVSRRSGILRGVWSIVEAGRDLDFNKEGGEDALPPMLKDDPRDFRARLVAAERSQAAGGNIEGSGWMYETTLLEQGSVLLGATVNSLSFALRQQFFHKCVVLLLSHTANFTKGIILNRPSAIQVAGWPVWYGGHMRKGNSFHHMGDTHVTCLHQLESGTLQAKSIRIVKGIYEIPLAEAKSLVDAGEAKKTDFWVFVGYVGWSSGELQRELQSGKWYSAAADSGLLFGELLKLAGNSSALPRLDPNSKELLEGDGLGTWQRLAANIGRAEDKEQATHTFQPGMLGMVVNGDTGIVDEVKAGGKAHTEGIKVGYRVLKVGGQPFSVDALVRAAKGDLGYQLTFQAREGDFPDRMLREWVRVHLTEQNKPIPRRSPSVSTSEQGFFLAVGSVLVSSSHEAFILDKQYLHKAILLVLQSSRDRIIAAVLNRPKIDSANFSLPGIGPNAGQPVQRRLSYGGDLIPYNDNLQARSANAVPLHHNRELGGKEIGGSGVFYATSNFIGEATDLLVVSGLVAWTPAADLQQQIEDGIFTVVPTGRSIPWERVWELAEFSAMNSDNLSERIADIKSEEEDRGNIKVRKDRSVRMAKRSCKAWELAISQTGDRAYASSDWENPLADDALFEWYKMYAT